MARRRKAGWERLPDEELLDVPIRDLGLRIEGTALEGRIARLYAELERAGLRFRPYVWLSTDWFTPTGFSGFAVPFFLAHPRLARLERRHMLEVEGGTLDWCLRLLRHETAHAIDNAYRLRRRKRFRQIFGPATRPYRDSYLPRPVTTRYVLNLDYWYAQSHPIEDFAETFAVWLRPGSRWWEDYLGWPALRKLEYVAELMEEVADQVPPVRTRTKEDPVSQLRMTLRQYYARKQAHYAEEATDEYDEPLCRVFTPGPADARSTAARFLARHRSELRQRVASVTGQQQYMIDQVLNELILRARRLRLRLARSEREALLETVALLTALTMSFPTASAREYRR